MTRTVTLAGYALLVAAAVVLEVASRRRGAATFADATASALRRPPLRLVALTAWLWLGWHLFVRVDW